MRNSHVVDAPEPPIPEPSLVPTTAVITRWAPVVYVVMVNDCIFAGEQVSTSR